MSRVRTAADRFGGGRPSEPVWRRLDISPLPPANAAPVQRSLFPTESGHPGEACDSAFSRSEHIDLGDGAWVDFHGGWVSAPEELFTLLRAETRWHGHSRIMYERRVAVPRLTGSPDPECAAMPTLRSLSSALSLRYARPLTEVSFAFYRDGNDSVAMHGDKLGAAVDDAIVAIVSLGGPRRFSMKRARPSGKPPLVSSRFWVGPDRLSFRPANGDLVVMGGNCQRTWLHGIPKVPRAAERIAVMFR